MKLPEWWKRSSSPAKVITVFAFMGILEIGLCAVTPWDSKLLGLLALLSVLTAIGLFVTCLIWLLNVFSS